MSRPHVLEEIDQYRAQAQSRIAGLGQKLVPPLLVLGTSERVGSNWLSDTLRPVMDQHNEPFRQQIGAGHPLSTLNPQALVAEGIADADLGALGRHWLVAFVVGKYDTRRHLVKETNLFFALPTLLRLFPDAPVVVLSRSPLGVASSFARGNLWRRWRYVDRYAQMVAMAPKKGRRWAALVPDDAPTELVALTRLVVLNTLLLANGLHDRDHTHVAYERTVCDHGSALGCMAELLPAEVPSSRMTTSRTTVDDTFTTTVAKSELVAALDPEQAGLVHAETARCLAIAGDLVAAEAADRASRWLAGEDLYRLSAPWRLVSKPQPRQASSTPPPVTYIAAAGVMWRNLLVSNTEFCALLNLLHVAGLTNTIRGTHLLITEMPYERGGRVHFDPEQDRWWVSPGFECHPVYWVSWIGAAVFALWEGARLPAHEELHRLTINAQPSNTDYTVGDTTPVAELGRGADELHHVVGNVQVWCFDGHSDPGSVPVARFLYGAAWNTPGTRAEVTRLRERHLLGSSRGVGIRLLRDSGQQSAEHHPVDLVNRLRQWITLLRQRDRTLGDLDRALLTLLQADVGLGAHV